MTDRTMRILETAFRIHEETGSVCCDNSDPALRCAKCRAHFRVGSGQPDYRGRGTPTGEYVAPDGYAIALATPQKPAVDPLDGYAIAIRAAEETPAPVVLSRAERASLGGYADSILAMRNTE